jgi:prevent-host-death family protein
MRKGRKTRRAVEYSAERSGSVMTVREAKARFSELVRLAAEGHDVTITSHGQPKARLVAAAAEARPFRVPWEWLRTMKVKEPQTPAEQIIREDRDARD